METNRFVGSFVNVILTRQTCGQRSSRAAESKRRALGNYFSERMCYMFLISKCRVGLCTTSGLVFGEPQRNGKIWVFLRRNTFFSWKSAALLERWPQICRVKITFTKLPTNRFVSTTKNSIKCVVNWIPLRIRVRSRNTQPHLNTQEFTRFLSQRRATRSHVSFRTI